MPHRRKQKPQEKRLHAQKNLSTFKSVITYLYQDTWKGPATWELTSKNVLLNAGKSTEEIENKGVY